MPLSKIDSDSLNSGAVTSAALASGVPTRAQLPAGTVLQVVSANTTTDQTITTSTPTLVVSASITPTSATSKILVLYNWNAIFKNNNSEGAFYLYYNGSNLQIMDGITPYTGTGDVASSGSIAGSYLHAPATTSAVTYSLYWHSNAVYYVRLNSEGGCTAITLLEIAA